MATRIRLQRHGRKNYAFYSIVIAHADAPRDGRFIEKVGTYNPNTNPATIDLNFERALYWVQVGAQPTDTVRNILSEEGVYLMKHLLGGVKKGAFDEAAVEAKFAAWKNEKAAKAQKAADKKAVDKKTADKKAKKENRFSLIRYFREMFGEVKKLTWLTGKELLSHTVAVFVFVIVMAVVIYVLDLAFGSGMGALESIKIG